MIRPLTLAPCREQDRDFSQEQYSPAHRQRADSLIFSITSQKNNSPKQTILIDTNQDLVQKQLQTLQLKLDSLQNKVHSITSEKCVIEDEVEKGATINKANLIVNRNKHYLQRQKENINNTNRIGKIVKKNNKDLSKINHTAKLNTSKTKNETFTAYSRNSLLSDQPSEIFQKERELHRLKKQASAMRQYLDRTERSKSLCSQKLSASKSVIKSLKKQQRKQEKMLLKLKADLKRSELIRQKQKQLILKQQQQIVSLRQHLRFTKQR